LPAHQHHQAKAKEQEGKTAKTVLNPDHFVVRGEDIFAPPTKLVVFMFASVRVWIVMRFDRSRRIHFQEKVIISISRGKRGLQSRKTFPPIKNGAPGSRALSAAASAIKDLTTVLSQDVDLEMAS
jgi:hypothetical protein